MNYVVTKSILLDEFGEVKELHQKEMRRQRQANVEVHCNTPGHHWTHGLMQKHAEVEEDVHSLDKQMKPRMQTKLGSLKIEAT